MEPAKEWLALYAQKKELTKSTVDFNKYFDEKEIAGIPLDIMDIGLCDLPGGKVIVADPLVYLDKDCTPYLVQAPAGSYKTEVCVIKPYDGDCARYVVVRLRFNQNRAVKFYEALIGSEDLENFEEGEYFGFNVDAGLGCICDAQVNKIITDWRENWEKQNPDGEIYNDYYYELFKESYKQNPQYQRDGGDWINWQVPGTDYHVPFFQAGFGDGTYPVYWGFDESGAVCQLIIQFIDIERDYSDEDEEE